MLRATGSLAAVGFAGSTAGCLDSLPVDAIPNPLRGASYSQWLYEPGAVQDRDHYGFGMYRPIEIDDQEDNLSEDLFDQLESGLESQVDPVGMDFDEVETYVGFGGALLLKGQYDTDEVIEELENADFESETDHEGYEIFVLGRQAWGVSGDALVMGRQTPENDPDEVVEVVIDTKRGEEDRYVDEVDGASKLVDTLGTATITFGITMDPLEDDTPERGNFENAIGQGTSMQINGERTTMRWITVFEEADEYDTDDFEDWIDEADGSDRTFDDVDDLNVNTQGTAVVVKGKIDTDDIGFNHF